MNQIVNKYLLAGDTFMPEMHLRQHGFTYSACGPFSRNKQRIQKFMETVNTNYIYRNELDKACFQHDMAYGKYKYLKRRTQSDKDLKDIAFENSRNQLANELHKPIIRKFTKKKYNLLLRIIFGVMI